MWLEAPVDILGVMAGSGGGTADDVIMAGFHDKNSRVVGTWKIIECVSLSGSSEATGIEGTEFVLSEAGDVTWRVTEGCDVLPLFSCQMYEVYTYQTLQCYGNRTLLRFAAYNGHVIEFRLDQPVMSRDLMLLTYDGWFMLQCEKLSTPETSPDLPYSLIPALNDGYFSDITITSKSGRKFEVHSIVLESCIPGLEWESLCGIEDAVLDTILHYLYCCCLPRHLTLDAATATIAATHRLKGFDQLRKKCQIFVHNCTLTNHLEGLMGEVEQCLEAMVQIFAPTDPVAPSPSHLITMLKAALRQMAIGVVKLVEVSREFEQCGRWLTQEEQHEVMRYARASIPILMHSTTTLLSHVRSCLAALNHHTRQQLAQQLVPEISSVLQMVCIDVSSLRTSLEHIIQASLESAHSPTHLLAKSLRNDLHLRELQKLRILQENLTSFLNSLVHKREQFEEMGGGARVRGVARIIEHFTEELTVLILRLDAAAISLEEMLDWSEFKFVFKGATSKVGSIVERLVEHRGVVECLVLELVERVAHPAFSTSLHNLGLLPPSQHPSTAESPSPDLPKTQEFGRSYGDMGSPGECEAFGDSSSRSNSTTSSDNPPSSAPSTPAPPRIHHHRPSHPDTEEPVREERNKSGGRLNLVRRVCEPPPSRTNPLALNIARLLTNPVLSDMTFIVVPPADDEASPSSSQEDLDALEGHEGSQTINKEGRNLDTADLSSDSTSLPQVNRVSSNVVRKVKKSLSLDRPSVRVPIATQAYSLDCDAVTCLNHPSTILPCDIKQLNADNSKVAKQGWDNERVTGGQVNCDDNIKFNVDSVTLSVDGKAKHRAFIERNRKNGAAVGQDSDNCDGDIELSCRLRQTGTVTLSKDSTTEGCSALEGGCECNNPDNHLVRPLDLGDLEVHGDQNNIESESAEGKESERGASRESKCLHRSKRCESHSKVCTKEMDKSRHESELKSSDTQSAKNEKVTEAIAEKEKKARLTKTPNIVIEDSSQGNNKYTSAEKDSNKYTIADENNKYVSLDKERNLDKAGNKSVDKESNIYTNVDSEDNRGVDKGGNKCVDENKYSGVGKEGTPEQKGRCSWEGVELKAHRVVVAARCEWFRRALLSGMREAIDRCIVVHGCSVQTFQLLLQFLYGGHVETTSLPPDQLVDLLVLADHYGVDALKLIVESGLEQHVDDESVVPLLTVAHHCNAARLKKVCIRHCVVSGTVLESESLAQLPDDLKDHLNMALGKQRKWMGAIGEELLVDSDGVGGEDSPLSVSSMDPLIDDSSSLAPSLEYIVGEEQSCDGCSGVVVSGNPRLDAVVRQLSEIVGPHIPRSRLIEITLAADYDLNRALNFFFK